jgi:hypothetical protein
MGDIEEITSSTIMERKSRSFSLGVGASSRKKR